MKNPIFIHGILRRSGTNLLNQMLLLHRNCVQPTVKIRENWFLPYSDPLWEYANNLFHMWSNPSWGGDEFSRIRFFHKIGESLLDSLGENISNTQELSLVTKTPSVNNITRCFDLFPNSKVLIIVRDPRDIAASAFRTWKDPIQNTIAAWNYSSNVISEFEKKTDPEKYMLIRYEDLVIDTEKLMREILAFLGLAKDDYSWGKLSKLPILGSSDYDRWQVHEHHDSFTPFGKWQSLPNAEKKYLLEVDKEYLTYFGYSSSQRKGFLPLPDREARISIDLETVCRKPTKKTTTTSFRERLVYAKKGMRLLAKSVCC